MHSITTPPEEHQPATIPTADTRLLRKHFLQWQCTVRQRDARFHHGRPGEAVRPVLRADDPLEQQQPVRVVTVLNRLPEYSRTPEMQHIFRKSRDPAERLKNALALFCETYYQRANEFSDVLTAVFGPDSPFARQLCRQKQCELTFEAHGHRYDLHCHIWRLSARNPLREATWWHNSLFNPSLSQQAEIIGFEPDWSQSTGPLTKTI